MTSTTPTVPATQVHNKDEERMFIRLKEYVYVDILAPQNYRKWIEEHKGQWVEVDTDYLFHDQYNTATTVNNSGEMDGGCRLYDTQIDAVRNDARIGKGKCKYCGKMVTTGQGCSKTVECIIHGIDWFTESNTFFLRFPTPPDVSIAPIEPVKVGTYTLEYSTYSDCFVLRNMRKTIRFKYIDGEYWINGGIGYRKRRFLDIPSSLTVKIKQALSKFINIKL